MSATNALALKNSAVKFAKDNGFQAEVRQRVAQYFEQTGKSERDCLGMYFKTAMILLAYITTYILLVFVVDSIWLALPLAVVFALAMAMLAFCVQHDGVHLAYSNYTWVNRMAATMLDILGASSYLWRFQHVVVHHTSPNVHDHDIDIDLGPIARVAPSQPRYWFHRWQHLYLWALYGLSSMRWHLYADFRDLLAGNMSGHPLPPATTWNIVSFVGGKLTSFAILLGIPMLFHPWWVVLLFYAFVCGLLGVLLSVTFQLAHCVEGADFPTPEQGTNRLSQSWAVHQVETTVNFCRHNRLITCFMGGLNFQIEHHLFPRICHIHYPAIAPIVEQTCKEYGVRYVQHRSLWDGLASHFRWLRRMGRLEVQTATA